MEERVLPLIGISEGGSANDAYRTSEPPGITAGRLLIERLWLPCFLHRVYTGEQMWEKVLDAGIEDALGVVRLGDSLELGGFLGYDLLKGRGSYKMCFLFDKSDSFS